MAREPDEKYQAIIDSVSQFPNGASLKNIVQTLKLSISYRSVKRRLGVLIKNGFLLKEGKTRSCLYRLPLKQNQPEQNKPIFFFASGNMLQQIIQPIYPEKPFLGNTDPFRLRYQNIIKAIVAKIVREKMDKESAVNTIKTEAQLEIPENDHARFLQTIEIELRSLHEGNIICFRLKPHEYDAWKKGWR